jgi:hypothetical protein
VQDDPVNGVHYVIGGFPGVLILQGELPKSGSALDAGNVSLAEQIYVRIGEALAVSAVKRDVGMGSKYGDVLDQKMPPKSTLSVGFAAASVIPIPIPPQFFPSGPVYVTCNNLYDAIKELWVGYTPASDGSNQALGIYQIMDEFNQWVVMCVGGNLDWSTFLDRPADYTNLGNIPGFYKEHIIAGVSATIPTGAIIHRIGHGSGSVALQRSGADLEKLGYQLGNDVQLGAVIDWFSSGTSYSQRYIINQDTSWNNAGLLPSYVFYNSLFALGIPLGFWHFLFDIRGGAFPKQSWMAYPDCKIFQGADVGGYRLGKGNPWSSTWKLGIPKRFPVRYK